MVYRFSGINIEKNYSFEHQNQKIQTIMKTLFSLVLLSIALAVHECLPTTTQFGLKCGFSQNKITCENLGITGQEVECDSVINIPGLSSTSVNIFGIGKLDMTVGHDLKQGHITLYPRTSEDLVYLDHVILLNGTTVVIKLYHDLTDTCNGIRVTDSVCYAKLIDLIGQVQQSGVQNVKVKSDLIGDAKELTLVGEVIIENQILQKRQYGYGGYGGYRGGFGGYGGYGGWGRYGGWGFGGYRGGYGRLGYWGKK